jgi:uncharacterized protein YciI|uniref:YCII-related domain-containing protein n=1 Tax=Phaeodactylum tricornutum TaxID=2850 RepID=A0A8J9X3E7_PHATR
MFRLVVSPARPKGRQSALYGAAAFVLRPPTRWTTCRSLVQHTVPLRAVQYILTYEYVPDVLEKRGPFRDEHLRLARDYVTENRAVAGGPTGAVGTNVPTGALFLFTDRDAAREFVARDPYVAHGIVTAHTIQEWNVVVQKADDDDGDSKRVHSKQQGPL